MSGKPPPFFTFFNFSSDVYNIFHIGLSQQHYPESTIFEDMRRLSHKMMINYPRNTYDKKTTRDHEDDGIMGTEEDFEEEQSLFEDIVCYVLYLIVSVI